MNDKILNGAAERKDVCGPTKAELRGALEVLRAWQGQRAALNERVLENPSCNRQVP